MQIDFDVTRLFDALDSQRRDRAIANDETIATVDKSHYLATDSYRISTDPRAIRSILSRFEARMNEAGRSAGPSSKCWIEMSAWLRENLEYGAPNDLIKRFEIRGAEGGIPSDESDS